MDRIARDHLLRAEEKSWFLEKTCRGWRHPAENLHTHGENQQQRQPAGRINTIVAPPADEGGPRRQRRRRRWRPLPKRTRFPGVPNSVCQDDAARQTDAPRRRTAPMRDTHRLRLEKMPTNNTMAGRGVSEGQ